MTILAAYTPSTTAINAEREYVFSFPVASDDAVYVYEENLAGVNNLVRQQDYSLTFSSSPRNPLKFAGRVRFNRPHGSDIVNVVIRRNTLIDQTVDFRNQTAFNTRMIEYGFDKMAMISQELNERKCNAGTNAPIVQQQIYGSYWANTSLQLNTSIDAMMQYLFEIDQSADDCRVNLAGLGQTP